MLGSLEEDFWSGPCTNALLSRLFSLLLQVLGSLEEDFVWIHDYHLLVLPSLLRKRFHRIK